MAFEGGVVDVKIWGSAFEFASRNVGVCLFKCVLEFRDGLWGGGVFCTRI